MQVAYLHTGVYITASSFTRGCIEFHLVNNYSNDTLVMPYRLQDEIEMLAGDNPEVVFAVRPENGELPAGAELSLEVRFDCDWVGRDSFRKFVFQDASGQPLERSFPDYWYDFEGMQ